jgi:hypothetical protein
VGQQQEGGQGRADDSKSRYELVHESEP